MSLCGLALNYLPELCFFMSIRASNRLDADHEPLNQDPEGQCVRCIPGIWNADGESSDTEPNVVEGYVLKPESRKITRLKELGASQIWSLEKSRKSILDSR